MFGYWLHYTRNPTYNLLMQALVNAGEEIAAKDLSKISGMAISKPRAGNIAEPSKQLGHVSLVFSGPSKEAKKQMKSLTVEYFNERESKRTQEFKLRLSRVRDLTSFNQWTQLYSDIDVFPTNLTLCLDIDMGEISEVQEICPILLTSNTFHFVCLDCHKDLSAQVTSVKSDTHHQTPYESAESWKDFLHQTLHTISSMWHSLKTQFSSRAFAAVIVGNNKERSQDRVTSVDKEIQSCLQECGCCQGSEIKYSHYRENKMIYTLNQSDNTYVKTVLKHIEKNQANHIKVPQSHYKLLCIWFFGGFQVIEYAKFEELAVICGINRKSVESSLEYIHRNTGIILHYADVPTLCNLVIRPQVLVDALSNLLVTALKYNPELHCTGVIKKCFLEEDIVSSSERSISPIGLIELLKHYNFLADLQGSCYFMPFFLQRYHLAREPYVCDDILQSSFPSPMIINFDSEDVPVGIFYGLVTQLSKSWQLSSEMQYKNRITFQFDDEIQCVVDSFPNCLEIRVIGLTKSYPIKLYDICLEITEILQLLLSFYKHTEDINFTFQFPCPGSFKRGSTFHFASIISSTSAQCKCNGPTPCTSDGVIPLTDHESITVWFANEQDPLELSSSNVVAKSQCFPDDDKVFNILQTHIIQEGSIRLRAAKSLLYGPPKVGKTSVRMRLTGEIENLSHAIPLRSTGIEKAITISLCHMTETKSVLIANNTNCWRASDIESQINIVVNCVLQPRDSLDPGIPAKSPKISRSKSSNSLNEFLYDEEQLEDTMEFDQFEIKRESDPIISPSKVSEGSLEHGKMQTEIVPTLEDNPTYISQTERKNDSDLMLFLKKMVKDQKWKEVQEKLQNVQDITLLQIIDIGGQPEFHEILPLLLTGPALYLVCINLIESLGKQYEITYTQEEGIVSPIKYCSNLTIKEMILQLFATIRSGSLSSSEKSSALILGTHKDQVSEETITMLENEIRKCKDFDVFRNKQTLKYFAVTGQSRLLFPLDNMYGTHEEVQILQDALSKIVQSHFRPQELPTSWYFFYFALRTIYENGARICPIEDAIRIASSFGISEEIIEFVLKHFHNNFGTILFYPDISGLNRWVICDANVIFKPISQLIAASFGENTDITLAEHIHQSGQFSLSVMERVVALIEEHPVEIPALAIIDLLKHHNIISEVQTHDASTIYFMPCLLGPDIKITEETAEQIHKLDPAPLVIQFPLGCIPVGLFPALIVQLSKKWILQYHFPQYKNRVRFVGDKQTMSRIDVILRTDKIELRVDCKKLEYTRQLCVDALYEVRSAMDEVKRTVSYMDDHRFEFGFYCPALSVQPIGMHFAVCYNLEEPFEMLCTHSVHCKEKSFDLQQKHKIWFPEHDVPVEEDMEVDNMPPPPKSKRKEIETLLKENLVISHNLERKPKIQDLMGLLRPIEYKWQDIGRALQVANGDLKSLEFNSTYTNSQRLAEVLYLWFNKHPDKFTWRVIISVVESQYIDSYSVSASMHKFISNIN